MESKFARRTPRVFAQSVRAGDWLFIAGQDAVDVAQQTLFVGDLRAQTDQCVRQLQFIMEAAGGTMDDIVKCTVMMADMAEWPAMNTVYATFFAKHFPARSAFGTTGLALGGRVEIECFARKPAP